MENKIQPSLTTANSPLSIASSPTSFKFSSSPNLYHQHNHSMFPLHNHHHHHHDLFGHYDDETLMTNYSSFPDMKMISATLVKSHHHLFPLNPQDSKMTLNDFQQKGENEVVIDLVSKNKRLVNRSESFTRDRTMNLYESHAVHFEL